MAAPVVVTDQNFDVEVLKSEKPVLVDFWAEWCGPCRMVSPIVEAIGVENGEKLKVAKLEVDDNPESSMKYGVMSIPTLIIFKGGQPVHRVVGYMPKERLLAAIKPFL